MKGSTVRACMKIVTADVRRVGTPKRGGMSPMNGAGTARPRHHRLHGERAVPTPFISRLILARRVVDLRGIPKKSEPPHVGCYERNGFSDGP